MTRLALLATLALLSGCETFSAMPAHEKTWHLLNAIDTGQTINAARRPDCWREVGFPTRQLAGEHPSEAGVYVTSAGYSYAYHRFARLEPETRAGRIAHQVVRWTVLLAKGATVKENHREGVRPWGGGCG